MLVAIDFTIIPQNFGAKSFYIAEANELLYKRAKIIKPMRVTNL